mmetsp:Transcript_42262/g.66965  ORF Transcript_42262/g.66965 Transcript_42262/m.66965 type:complete len:247 (+) Transcript_42262:539-1279(+)
MTSCSRLLGGLATSLNSTLSLSSISLPSRITVKPGLIPTSSSDPSLFLAALIIASFPCSLVAYSLNSSSASRYLSRCPNRFAKENMDVSSTPRSEVINKRRGMTSSSSFSRNSGTSLIAMPPEASVITMTASRPWKLSPGAVRLNSRTVHFLPALGSACMINLPKGEAVPAIAITASSGRSKASGSSSTSVGGRIPTSRLSLSFSLSSFSMAIRSFLSFSSCIQACSFSSSASLDLSSSSLHASWY